MSAKETFKPIRKGMTFPMFAAGNKGPQISSASDMNLLVRSLQSLTNVSIVRGESDDVKLSDGNFVIQLAGSEGGSSALVQQFVLTDASSPDVFICRSLAANGTIGATNVSVAKPFHLRTTAFDGLSVDVTVESWDGATLSTEVRTFSYDYKSATFRIKTDAEDVSENQTIIPRLVPAVVVGSTTDTVAPTIIYAVQCATLPITGVSLLALNDGWAWAKVSE